MCENIPSSGSAPSGSARSRTNVDGTMCSERCPQVPKTGVPKATSSTAAPSWMTSPTSS
jgi:hypothetical protein